MLLRLIPIAAMLVVGGSIRADDEPLQIDVYPSKIELTGRGATQRVVAVGRFADGSTRDVTDRVTLQPADSKIGIDPARRVIARADGDAELLVRMGELVVNVPVFVRGAAIERPVSFRNDVTPAMTRLGCNQGACHGSQHGKGGFKLSLLGFEPEPDYAAIIKSAEGRRASPARPEESLVLLKPTLTVAHGGGKRMAVDGREYELIREWLNEGAAPPAKDDAKPTALRIEPDHRTMSADQTQRFVATAVYSDGSIRDVTDDVRFDALNEGVATVTKDGVATAVAAGETSILARYSGLASLARLAVPFGPEKAFDFPGSNIVDAKSASKWRSLGLAPSDLCTDSEFLRRAMLDLIGTTPTQDEVDEFAADARPDKRAKLVDRLLDRPEYVDFWTLKWGDLLRVNSDKLGPQGMLAFNLWLRDSFRNNKPLDTMVRELITAQGSIYTNGPANYYRVATGPDELAETTAQVFMGVRLQCAKCHHHPFEAYGQDEYYGLAAYFARIGVKNSQEFGLFGREQVIFVRQSGEVRQPRTGQVMKPKPVGGAVSDDPSDRRRALASWLVERDNPWLARSVANRYWGYLMGRGLVDPIDDLRETNPPSNPELLDALASELVRGGFDLKHLLRTIATSRVYSLSSLATPDNRLDSTFFTHYPMKRLTAEQLLDAVNSATATTEKFNQRPAGTRAIALPDSNFPSYFLDTFGRPERAIACECERGADPTLGQALHLMNGELINRKINQPDGRLNKMFKDPKLSDGSLIATLYRVTFARAPSAAEDETARRLLADAPDRKTGAQDLLWGLLNSKEFLFNH